MSFPLRRFLSLSLFTAACAPSSGVSGPTPDGSVAYLIRLGRDTVAIEQYRRTGNHIDSDIMQRSPMTYVGHSAIDLAPNGLATSWTYDPRLVSGTRPIGAVSRALTFSMDSVTVVSDTGARFSRRVAGGPAVPNIQYSMLTYELAAAYARAQGRDSVAVPIVSGGGGHGALPIRFLTRDSVRSWYGPDPVFMKFDSQGHLTWFDGTASTNKIVASRVTGIDVRTVATDFSVRDQMNGAMGSASPRDTARAQIGGSKLWIDYGRPALRGRNAWVNGVLGDTLWRTGANAATQFRTEATLRIDGKTIPAGLYTLWTHVLPRNSGYELIFNKQVGQWGTVYDPKQDLVRVPLIASQTATSAERFTMTIEPGPDGGVLAMQWGNTRLETPFTIVR